MKIHCTAIYGLPEKNNIRKKQQYIMDCGRKLGFYEMGIFKYPVDTDSDAELSSRLDGIIAGVEKNDVVIFQLPTGNGEKYDTRLLRKMKAYSGSKVILLIHDLPEYDSLVGLNCADLAVFVNKTDRKIATENGLRVKSVIGIPTENSGEL